MTWMPEHIGSCRQGPMKAVIAALLICEVLE